MHELFLFLTKLCVTWQRCPSGTYMHISVLEISANDESLLSREGGE